MPDVGWPRRPRGTTLAIFVDRCLTPPAAAALNKVPGVVAVHLNEVYGPRGPAVPDVEWIKDCGQRGWIAITKNPRMSRTPSELEAIVDNETCVFSLKRADLPREEVGLVFGRYFLRMKRRSNVAGGCFWRIGLDGDIRDVR